MPFFLLGEAMSVETNKDIVLPAEANWAMHATLLQRRQMAGVRTGTGIRVLIWENDS
jgi:hypothetical protein